MKKKLSTFDAYFQICFGKKLMVDGKLYGYWDINHGKALSLREFRRFVEKVQKKNGGYVQMSIFE